MYTKHDIRDLILANALVIFGFIGLVIVFDRMPTDTTVQQGRQVYETIYTHQRTSR